MRGRGAMIRDMATIVAMTLIASTLVVWVVIL
jgi:hypothetical protein